MAANNNIYVTVTAIEGKKLTTPKKYSLPCRNATCTDKTNADIPATSSEYRFYFGGIERVYELDKSAYTVHALMNGALANESGVES